MSCLENDKIREDFYEKLIELFENDAEVEYAVFAWASNKQKFYCAIKDGDYDEILEDLEESIWSSHDDKYPYCQSSAKEFILNYLKD